MKKASILVLCLLALCSMTLGEDGRKTHAPVWAERKLLEDINQKYETLHAEYLQAMKDARMVRSLPESIHLEYDFKEHVFFEIPPPPIAPVRS